MRFIYASLALAPLSLAASPAAFAQAAAPASIAPGMAVVDTSGGAVGTVVAVKGDLLTVKTDKYETTIGIGSVTPDRGKVLIGMTQAELNAAIEQSVALAAAKFAPGAIVKGTGGAVIGTVESIEADFATVKLETGESVRIPRSGMAPHDDGLVVGLTLDQLKAQLGSSAS